MIIWNNNTIDKIMIEFKKLNQNFDMGNKS